MYRLAILLAGFGLLFSATATAASASSAPQPLQATFVDIYSSCPISPPSIVFCGNGTIAQFGGAESTVTLTSIAPIPGSDCLTLTAVRTIKLDEGNGSLTMDESGTLCPPSDAASNAKGGPYTVAKTYTIVGGTGVFDGAYGTGTDINRSAGNSQVSVISGTITTG
jgi:hypothetical protein